MNNQSSSKDSMPNEYVDEKSAAEKSVTDQHVPDATPDATNPVEAIGEAVGTFRFSDDDLDAIEAATEGVAESAKRVVAEAEARQKKDEANREARMAAIREETRIEADEPSWFEQATMDFDKKADEAIAEGEARRKQAEAEREARMAAIREETTHGTNIFETQSWGFEEGDKALAEMKARQLAADGERQQRMAGARCTADIVERARRLEPDIRFKDVKKVRNGDMYIPQAQMTDQNKMVVLDALFKDRYDRPHRDLFLGRIVDHEGYIIDDHYPVHEWIEAFAAAGLKGVSAKAAREILREWALKREFERNDLIEHVKRKTPEWDGKKRMAASLVELFKCDDTELNREFSEYFWLSLYSRVMYPGSQAPIVLSLFGAQNCGKSYFGKRLARIITGNPNADSVQLNLAGERLDFLRNITGFSVIASVGEMTGFTRGDLNKIKDFITRTNDMLHYKYEGTFNQPRQFIIVMDGNKYEGLQRDDSGNRRFYPMFCGRLPDQDGQPRWSEDFNAGPTIHSDEFEADVWQIMAECAEWFAENGEEGYNQLVGDVSSKVSVFNSVERAANRGTIHDPDVEAFLTDAIIRSEKRLIRKRDGSGRVGVAIRQSDLIIAFKDVSQVRNPNHRHIALAMKALHADEQKTQNRLAYYFDGYESIEAFEQFISGESDHEVVEAQPMKRKSEEF